MVNVHLVLDAAAVLLFVVAGFPNLTAPSPVRCEWLAAACLTLTLIL